jgi:hypothetical protein
VAILALSKDSWENKIPPLVFSLGVKGKTKILYPLGLGSSSTVSLPIFSGDKGSRSAC